MSAALGLLRLQQVDSQISQIQSRLQLIRETLENNAEVQAARQQLTSAETDRDGAEAARRDAEMQAQSQRMKIQQAESSLYGGAIRNPKELQDLQADVASLKKHLSAIEDAQLVSMLTLEDAQSNVQTAKDRLGNLMLRLEAEHEKLIAEREKLTRTLQDLQTERIAALSAVPAEHLQSYSRLLQSRRGRAVAEVTDNACAACGTILTAALQQSARHASQLVYCPSCGRILYAG
jgi:uncharacterized protein